MWGAADGVLGEGEVAAGAGVAHSLAAERLTAFGLALLRHWGQGAVKREWSPGF